MQGVGKNCYKDIRTSNIAAVTNHPYILSDLVETVVEQS